MTRAIRVLLAVAAVACAFVGVQALRRAVPDLAAALPIVLRAAAAPLIVDLLLVPAVVVAGRFLRRRLSDHAYRLVVAPGVLTVLVTLVAIPFLAAVGRRPDNPTLLDRNYWLGWLLLLAVVWIPALMAACWQRIAASNAQ